MITAVVDSGEVAASEDAPVPWWSIAKIALAAAALKLLDQGRLTLDGRVPARPFTLRQVLQHRAGLSDYGALPAYHAAVAAGEAPWPAGEMLERAGADRLIFAPGEDWAYSNVGYFLVRALIEGTTGRQIGEALEDLVFGPLGVAGVALATTPADLERTAWGNAARYHPGWVYHGLLTGPAASAALFVDRLFAGGLLSPPLLAAMCDAHPLGGSMAPRPWTSAAYGLGLMIGGGEGSERFVGHTGGGPGSSSAVYLREAATGGRRTAAAFAPVDDPATVETAVVALTRGSGP